jgi:hypothetical protein
MNTAILSRVCPVSTTELPPGAPRLPQADTQLGISNDITGVIAQGVSSVGTKQAVVDRFQNQDVSMYMHVLAVAPKTQNVSVLSRKDQTLSDVTDDESPLVHLLSLMCLSLSPVTVDLRFSALASKLDSCPS